MSAPSAEPVLACLPGVGPKTARLIALTFGKDALRVVASDPERLTETPGLGPARAQAINRAWKSHRHQATAQGRLAQMGLSEGQRKAAWRRWGEGAASLLARDPYRLAELRGQGFPAADKLASSVGITGTDPRRIAAASLYLLERSVHEGHTYTAALDIYRQLHQMGVMSSKRQLMDCLQPLADQDKLTLSRSPEGQLRVALSWMSRAERRLAELTTSACEESPAPSASVPDKPPGWLSMSPTDEQWKAIRTALERRLSLIVGRPGTGKSQSVRLLCETAEKMGFTVALCAPTGKAAKRLEQLTGRHALTVHRLLDLRPGMSTPPTEPDAELVVCDEASMLDVPLAGQLMQACRHTRLVLCGDADQLPAVGAGRVLDDMASSGQVPTVRLNRIFRQAARSMIVQGAHHINRGELPPVSAEQAAAAAGLPQGAMRHDFFIVERVSTSVLVDEALSCATSRLPRALGLDGRSEVMVLCAQHNGPAGTIEVGRRLQQHLNPHGEPIEGTRLRVGDRLIHTANDIERGLMNGEICQLLEHRNGQLLICDSQEREVWLPAGDAARQLQLAYALTVHRAQGSSAPAVVALLPQGAPLLATRNLLYTAITRAEQMCVLSCHPAALKAALTRQAGARRRSTLAERLCDPALDGRLC